MFSDHDSKFVESQLLRVAAIASYKKAGDALLQIQELLGSATKTNPVETDLGTFTSFNEYLDSGVLDVGRTSAYQAIKIAKHWDIVLKLGMQDTSSHKTLSKSMRVSRTIKIIDWYLQALQDGRREEDLTLDLYWEENEPSPQSGPTKKQLQQQNEELQAQVLALLEENARLRAQLNPMPAALLAR